QRDVLGYGGFRENLVLTLDVIQINSWHEIVCRHYGNDALINGLFHYFRMVPPGRGLPLPELTIRCFSSGQGAAITQRLQELWRDILVCFYSKNRSHNSRYILEMGDEYLLLQYLQQQPHITRYKTYEMLLEKLGNAQVIHSPLVIDRHGLGDKPLKLFAAVASAPGVYVFYQPHPEQMAATVTVIDEKGSLFSYGAPYQTARNLLRPLDRFIRSVMERQSVSHDMTSPQLSLQGPQFFEVMGNVKQQQGYLEKRRISRDTAPPGYIEVKAIAEPDSEGRLGY